MADYNLGVYRPRPRGEFDGEAIYRYLDIVRFKGATYINIFVESANQITNTDEVAIDGANVNSICIGILPTGQDNSEQYWMCIAEKGDKGDTGDIYTPYVEVTNGTWDFSKGDKCFIPENASGGNGIVIDGVYNGCCGMIITKQDLVLPNNSLKSVDYGYCSVRKPTDYYFYTFSYAKMGSNYFYIWHRTVITNA